MCFLSTICTIFRFFPPFHFAARERGGVQSIAKALIGGINETLGITRGTVASGQTGEGKKEQRQRERSETELNRKGSGEGIERNFGCVYERGRETNLNKRRQSEHVARTWKRTKVKREKRGK